VNKRSGGQASKRAENEDILARTYFELLAKLYRKPATQAIVKAGIAQKAEHTGSPAKDGNEC